MFRTGRGDDKWGDVEPHRTTMRLHGGEFDVLDEPARAVQVALHAAQHGHAEPKPMEDLRRALRLESETWRQAAALATELDAVDAFATGLRLLPEGQVLALRLGLDVPSSALAFIRARSLGSPAESFHLLMRTRGVRARTRLVFRGMLPTPSMMRTQSARARSGRWGLTVSYLSRLARLPARVVSGFRGWRRAERDARGRGSG